MSWIPQATDASTRGLRQIAWQVLVASSREILAADQGDLWDSGRVASAETTGLPYLGARLVSARQVFWKVRLWDQAGQVSVWSEPARWTMGVLTAADWGDARWIQPTDGDGQGPLLRREFTVKPGMVRATVHVSGLGQYEMRLNGTKVGEDLLAPGWTNYRKTVLYDTYDITAALRTGPNAVGLTLGNGMYRVRQTPGRYNKFVGEFGPLKACAVLRLFYADGTRETIGTDARWRVHAGPITYSNVYGGEDYDARRNPAGWDQPGFTGSDWTAAVETTGPGGMLTGLSAAGWPIRAGQVLKPVGQKEIKPGIIVYDLGQNVALMPRLTVTGAAGARVRIIPSELVKPDGEIDDPMCDGKAYWTYTLAGQGSEFWFPQFFYRGARYLQVELSPAGPTGELPRVTGLEGVVVHAAAPAIGEFSTSSELFNRIHTLVRWAQSSNMMSVFTDCPQREKLGWLEETYLNGPALRYNFDLNPLFAKVANDIDDARQPDGLVPNIAPEYTVFGWWDKVQFRESAEWGSSFVQVPWQQYLFTGDLTVARRHYAGMKSYLNHLRAAVNPDGILHIPGDLGDWYDIGPAAPGPAQLTPVDLSATAIYADDAAIMATLAEKLGETGDAREFRKLAMQIRAAFDRAYLDPDQRHYATGSQTANSLPLALGLVNPAHCPDVLQAVVQDVRQKGLTAGDVGYRYLLRALADGGRSDVVFALNHQEETPGYGLQLRQGATSLTEAWDAGRASSQNHFMLGQINEWFFHDLAGIQPDPAAPGFANIVIKPAMVGDLDWVRANYASVRGAIESHWTRRGNRIRLHIVIPPNTTATVYVPAREAGSVREGGRAVAGAAGVQFLRMETLAAVFAVGSGSYDFDSTLP